MVHLNEIKIQLGSTNRDRVVSFKDEPDVREISPQKSEAGIEEQSSKQFEAEKVNEEEVPKEEEEPKEVADQEDAPAEPEKEVEAEKP